MASAAALNAERFLADKAAPICGLDVAKSFALLRYI
jgi:dipeptidyl-peptidase-3